MTALVVATAGAVGVLARYGLGLLSGSPWATLAINVAGSFALGLVAGAGGGLPPAVRDAVAVGLLGGFTTYSTFSLQAVAQLEDGRAGAALAYVAASVVLGLGAAAAGLLLGRG